MVAQGELAHRCVLPGVVFLVRVECPLWSGLLPGDPVPHPTVPGSLGLTTPSCGESGLPWSLPMPRPPAPIGDVREAAGLRPGGGLSASRGPGSGPSAVTGGSRPGVRAAAVRAWGERACGDPGSLAPSRCQRPAAHIGAGAHPHFPPGVSFSHPRAHPFSGLDSLSESPQGRSPRCCRAA